MACAAGPDTIEDGLVLCLDAANTKSYSGAGTSIYNLIDGVASTINGPFTFANNTIWLENDTGFASTNVSYIQCPSLTNITSVCIWHKPVTTVGSHYLLDMRTGGANGWIYSGGPGSDWSTGAVYMDGELISASSISWANAVTYGQWQYVTLIASTPATDDITLFSRYSANEGIDTTVGMVQIYDRVLTADEIEQNFQAQRGRFGI